MMPFPKSRILKEIFYGVLFCLVLLLSVTRVLAQDTPVTEQPAAEKGQVLVIGLSVWAPYKGYDLPAYGMATEVIQVGMARAGYSTHIKRAPWARVYKDAVRGDVDIIPGLWYSEERDEKVAFGPSIAENRLVFISRKKDGHVLEKISDLERLVVGVAQDYAYPKAFQEATNFYRDVAVNLEISLKKLANGRVDATIADELVARYTANNHIDDPTIFLYSDTALEIKNLFLGISRMTPGYQQILEKFEKVFEEMKSDGTYKAILKKHGLLDSEEAS